MRLGRIDLNAYDVIDSNSLERDAGGKVLTIFLIPLQGEWPAGAWRAGNRSGFTAADVEIERFC
jgi:hypothetical protein